MSMIFSLFTFCQNNQGHIQNVTAENWRIQVFLTLKRINRYKSWIFKKNTKRWWCLVIASEQPKSIRLKCRLIFALATQSSPPPLSQLICTFVLLHINYFFPHLLDTNVNQKYLLIKLKWWWWSHGVYFCNVKTLKRCRWAVYFRDHCCYWFD